MLTRLPKNGNIHRLRSYSRIFDEVCILYSNDIPYEQKDEQEEMYRSYRVAFGIIRSLSPESEPDDYICNICGEIICTEETETELREVCAGTVHGYLINVNASWKTG
jgi:hypothetical protein